MTDPAVATTWAQALSWRLDRHLLEPLRDTAVAEVVGRLGAVLSMNRALADLAVCLRSTTSRPEDLSAALAGGTVVEVFAFRGATHYVTPDVGADLLSLRCAGRQWELRSWVDHYRLTAEDWPGFRAAVRDALGGGPLTVAELGESLAGHRAYAHLRPFFEDGAGTLVKPLTWQGDVSLGPRRDGRLTLQRLDDNPHWPGLPELEEAGPRALLAHVRTYGPVTPDQLHRWFGSGLSAGRRRIDRWIAGLAEDLVELDVDGTTAYAARLDVDGLLAAQPTEVVRLLPGHDQWVTGPGSKDEHVTPAPLRDLMTRKANPVVVGGVVSGTWSRQKDDLTVAWLADGPRPDRAIHEEAERLGRVLGRGLRVIP